jgi:hypothetical protein
MELLFDSEGHVVTKDGKPVYKYADGKEIPFDAKEATVHIASLKEEAKGHRLEAKQANEKLKLFGDLDPEKAKEAITTVANLDAKKLVDAGKIDAVKQQMAEDFEANRKQMIENFEQEKSELSSERDKANNHLFNMMVEGEFYKSPLFNGKDSTTTMTADVAYALFRDNFSVDTEGEQPRIVAKLDGEEILSRERPGKPATFHEALDKIWEKYPNRTRYEESHNGGGGSGNDGDGGSKTFATPKDRIAAGLRAHSKSR